MLYINGWTFTRDMVFTNMRVRWLDNDLWVRTLTPACSAARVDRLRMVEPM